MAKAAVLEPPTSVLAPRDGQCWRVGDPLPAVLLPIDLAVVLRLHPKTIYRLQAAGELEPFELKPRIGTPRYSGRKVQAYLDGEAAPSRFFSHGRRKETT